MLNRILDRTAREYAQNIALVYDQRRVTYQQLQTDVIQLSQGLRKLGVGRSHCVALLLPNCPEFVISFYAIARLGAIALPLNPMFKEDELHYYLQDSEACAIITNRQGAELCAPLLSTLDRTVHLITLDPCDTPAMSFQDLIQSHPVEEAIEPDLPLDSPCVGDVLYQYSSGSTGRPKRVSRTHQNLVHESQNFASTVQITAADSILCIVPLFHAHGLGNGMLAAMLTGAKLVFLEPYQKNNRPSEVPFIFRSPRVIELIQKEGITLFPGVPYLFAALAEAPIKLDTHLSTLRLCFSAGNFLSREIYDKFKQRFNLPIKQLYGCTEAGSVAIHLDMHEDAPYDSVGRPLQNVTVNVVGDNGQEQPIGAVGELVICSGALTSGYHNMPELNRQAFKEGCFYTGDLGKKDEQGRLYITGRKKLFIDTGGRKVDPLEIEDILTTHPKVKEVVVVGAPSPDGGELIKAVVVPEQDCQKQEIIAFCREKLADFKVPRIVDFRPEIPKSPLGKVLRKNLI